METMTTTTDTGRDPDTYPTLLDMVRVSYAEATRAGAPLFRVDSDDLYDLFLDWLPIELRQRHDCRTCRSFVTRYGGLVAVEDSGETRSVMWALEAPAPYTQAVKAMRRTAERRKIVAAHVSADLAWGQAQTGEWSHFAVTQPQDRAHRHPLLSAGQMAARIAHERECLERALAEYPTATVRKAHAMLEAEKLARGEVALPIASWLSALHDRIAARDAHNARAHIIWHAAATAPEGWCHVKTTMLGSLLDDLQTGMSENDVARRFADKVRGDQYQRPTAAPSAGQLDQAERLVETLGLERSLARRAARLDDVRAYAGLLWEPPATPREDEPAGVFGHLRQKTQPERLDTPTVVTWVKFAAQVLPGAEAIECCIPASAHLPLAGLVTATHADAPPIVQWDEVNRRNPVTWYMYTGGSPAESWGLTPGRWARVTAITLQPNMWHRHAEHRGRGVLLVLDGARDVLRIRRELKGGGLFPEHVRGELHGVRRTIEAHSNATVLAELVKSDACGLLLQQHVAGITWLHAPLRVLSRGVWTTYRLDRWD